MEILNLNYKIFGLSELTKNEEEVLEMNEPNFLEKKNPNSNWKKNKNQILRIAREKIFLQIQILQNQKNKKINLQKISKITRVEFEIKNSVGEILQEEKTDLADLAILVNSFSADEI